MGAKEYHRVTQCNKPHASELSEKGTKQQLPLARSRDNRGLGNGGLLWGLWSMCSKVGESTALPEVLLGYFETLFGI